MIQLLSAEILHFRILHICWIAVTLCTSSAVRNIHICASVFCTCKYCNTDKTNTNSHTGPKQSVFGCVQLSCGSVRSWSMIWWTWSIYHRAAGQKGLLCVSAALPRQRRGWGLHLPCRVMAQCVPPPLEPPAVCGLRFEATGKWRGLASPPQ